jgi:glutaminase
MADAGTFPLPSREAAAAAAEQEEAITAAVELYMMLNSVDVTCDSLAVLAGTLAAGGVCPVTGERVLPAEAAKNALCFMQSCGFGVESGEFAFGVGFPAMGCASGAVIVVVPNLFGACFYNPTVNAKNNPVRGMHFCQALSDTFNFHMYDKVDPNTKKIDPKLYAGNDTQAMVNSLLGAASGGDLNALRSLHAMELDLSLSDYDSRAAAHLAASEGHVAVLRFLAEQGVSLFARDRWGNTPLDDAMREGHTETVDTLHRWFDRS